MVEVETIVIAPPDIRVESGGDTQDFENRPSSPDGFAELVVFEEPLRPFDAPDTAELETFRAKSLVQLNAPLEPSPKTLKRRRSSPTLPVAEKRLKKDPAVSSALECKSSTAFHSTWPTQPAPSCSFLNLPAEIRQQIYHLLFVISSAIRPVSQDPRYYEDRVSICGRSLGPCIQFLRTNSSIHQEASSVLYGQNRFVVYGLDNGTVAFNFLESIGERNRRAIRSLELDWQHGYSTKEKLQHLRDLFAKINDNTYPLREDLARAVHAITKERCQLYADSIGLFQQPPKGCLRHLTLNLPTQDSELHPQNFCHRVNCSGCEKIVGETMRKVKGLDTLTMGESEWKSEVEVVARAMEAKVVNVTKIECLEMTEETKQELEQQGWKSSVIWRSEDDEDEYRSMLTKVLQESTP